MHPFRESGAFRQCIGCQSSLLRFVDDWRRDLDSNEYAAAILMDLSRVFDNLPHYLLLGKLRAFGVSDKACALIGSYSLPS